MSPCAKANVVTIPAGCFASFFSIAHKKKKKNKRQKRLAKKRKKERKAPVATKQMNAMRERERAREGDSMS